MIEELEHKIMTKKRFTKAVEVLVSQKNMSYIAIVRPIARKLLFPIMH